MLGPRGLDGTGARHGTQIGRELLANRLREG